MKKYDIPPLGLFHSFEVVARHQSFTLAANELCLTQSAVSRQIIALEEQLGLPLFHRKHRAIELTTSGIQLFDAVAQGLDVISECISTCRKKVATPHVTVATSVAFAYFWLMPRLERFNALHPEIDLRILTSDQRIDLRRSEADVAVLYGSGNWDGVTSTLLFGEKVYPVCSKAYMADHPELNTASDLLDQTLLHLHGGGNIWGGVDWRLWLIKQGITGRPVRQGIQVNSYPMLLQAAESGRGLALGWSYITDAMLADGRLVCPIGKPLETSQGYYVCASDDHDQSSAGLAFMEWVCEEVERLS